MKVSELVVGNAYKINYRKDLAHSTYQPYSRYSRVASTKVFKETPTIGYGVLREKDVQGHEGFHRFALIENGHATSTDVFASSRGVLANSKKSDHGLGLPVEPIKIEDPELEKLKRLGFDDDTRKEQVVGIQTFLAGLGIESDVLGDHTGIAIPYAGLAQLRLLVRRLYTKAESEND